MPLIAIQSYPASGGLRPTPAISASAQLGSQGLWAESDYGSDLVMYTFEREGYVEPGVVYLQLKAAEELSETIQEIP